MTEPSKMGTKPLESKPPPSTNKLFFLTLLIGMLMGVIMMCLVGYGLYFFGYVHLTGEAIAQPPVDATVAAPPVCPTCEPGIAEPKVVIVTATPEPTPTIDAAATATAACGAFNLEFPGTPCPSPVAP